MGISSSKSKQTTNTTTTSTPLDQYAPYITQGLQNTNSVFQQNQPALQSMTDAAAQGFSSLADRAFSTSPYLTNAQNVSSAIGSGALVGTNPGQATYNSLQAANDPSIDYLTRYASPAENPGASTLSSIASSTTTPGDYSGIGSSNPAYGMLARAANNSYNPASDTLSAMAGGFGGGQQALSSIANAGPNADTAQFYKDTLAGKYLNDNPYIDQITQQATDAATKTANQRFAASGMGEGMSTPYSQALGTAVANANNQTRYTAYNNELTRMGTIGAQSDSAYNSNQANRINAATGLNSSQLGAATALGSQYNDTANRQLTAAQGLGSLYNSTGALSLQANQAKDAAYQANQSNRLAAGQALGSQFLTAQAQGADAAKALGSQYTADNNTKLNAATASDQAQATQYNQMLAALGLQPSLESGQYAGVSPALNTLTAAATLPYTGVTAYDSLVNGLTAKYGTQTGNGTTTTTSTPSLWNQFQNGLGTALKLGSMFG